MLAGAVPRRQPPRVIVQGYVGGDGTLVTWFAPNVGDGEIGPPDLAATDLPTAGRSLFTVDAVGSDDTYRVFAQRSGDHVEVTAVLIDDELGTVRRLIAFEVLGALAILTALGFVTWWMLQLGIKPIKDMTHTATLIAGGDLSVRVPESAPGTEPAELAVALNQMLDHGPGMDSHITERVTERFFRADPARSRHRGGSGLGLSIVDATVSAHRGSVDIDSEKSRGTTVRLTMPATPETP